MSFDSLKQGVQRNLQSVAFSGAVPVQTYYVPFEEEILFNHTFVAINEFRAMDPVTTLLSLAIAAANTIIWYDHGEDGYDSDVTMLMPGSTTEVWGDGDCSNGFRPDLVVCIGADDTLGAGDVLVIENDVPLPRVLSDILFDGGDKIQASFPIAMTRGAFPVQPGSLMAGAVEVLNTAEWGTSYVSPVGTDTTGDVTMAFEYSALYVQASKDGTLVFKNGVQQGGALSEGEGIILEDIKEGDEVTTNNPVQVHLLVGDILSNFELRWYGMTPREKWSNIYYTPVGTGAPPGGFDGNTTVCKSGERMQYR